MRLGQVGTVLFSLGGLILGKCRAQSSCIGDIQTIYDMESMVTDTSIHRTYTICPQHIFLIGNLDRNFDLRGFRVHPPLPIRPNMTIKCGETGSRENLCWINEGDVQIDATPLRGISDPTVENVLIEGLVFINARRHALWATKPGSITFRDCEFRDFTRSVVPLLLDWHDGSDSHLTVTIEDSYFHDNRYFGAGSNTALIYANSNQNILNIRGTIFEKNDMTFNNTLASTNSFLIETLGSLTVHRLCFIDNEVGVSNIVVFGNRFIDDDIFVSNSMGGLCSFASVFENIQQFDTFSPLCVNSLATSCNALAISSQSPTISPTSEPTTSPTDFPSITPTFYTSLQPSFVPSIKPTILISEMPSTRPTVMPTRFSSMSPSITPTPVPTPEPTIWPTPGPTPRRTSEPTTSPTLLLSTVPTAGPTSEPTSAPTHGPTKKPTPAPTIIPTTEPTTEPTIQPATEPSTEPTIGHTRQPSIGPVDLMTEFPSSLPSTTSTSSLPPSAPTSKTRPPTSAFVFPTSVTENDDNTSVESSSQPTPSSIWIFCTIGMLLFLGFI